MRVAACNWEIASLRHRDEFYDRLFAVGTSALKDGVDLLVLPECIVLELASLYPDLTGPDLMVRIAEEADRFEQAISKMASEIGAVIGGSHFRVRDSDHVEHFSRFAADGVVCDQPKNVMTQFERHEWRLQRGRGLFPASFLGRTVGTLVCYDSEFPSATRALVEAGAELVCVPAYTETRRGFQRVRWSCQARALENQIYVIHASLIGSFGREPIPTTFGSSAILCPSVRPFPESAVLAETPLNQPGLAIADLDFDMLAACREDDDVRNWHDRNEGDWTVRS